MAFEGTRLSWSARFRHVAEALCCSEFCESECLEQWAEARKTMAGPDAYIHLVGVHLAASIAAAKSSGSSPLADGTPLDFENLQWLPKWCLARDPGSGESPEIPDDEREGEAVAESEACATLWFGDIPREIADAKRVNEVLYPLRPPTIATPYIRKVVRQGYRASVVAARMQSHDSENGGSSESSRRSAFGNRPTSTGDDSATCEADPWLGYAFIAFRDKQEAEEALKVYDGKEVEGGWIVRASWAEDRHQKQILRGRRFGPRLRAAGDPSLGEQLFPACLHGEDLASAVERHHRATGVNVRLGSEAWVFVEAIKAFYRLHSRRQVHAAGCQIPDQLLEPLLQELRRTRWPPAPHRSGMQAEHYLVLHRGKANDGFEELLELLEGLLAWADPDFGCNRIAVTKNFQGSPHIDSSDVTYQYATSLGDFKEGGELCVEGEQPGEVYVVNTHNRLARIDGRFVHWVRGYAGGDRYSLIFFSTNPGCARAQTQPFFADFQPYGAL